MRILYSFIYSHLQTSMIDDSMEGDVKTSDMLLYEKDIH